MNTNLTRISAGVYTVQGRYLVEKHTSGWLWRDSQSIGTSGEWRSTRREAYLDLLDFLTVR
jgi:hypothetical protein